MEFNLAKSIQVLERTPAVLETLLEGISDDWIMNNEGEETWSPYDIVGHLIHGEHTDWIPRAEIILKEGGDKRFTPFDRFAQFQESEGKGLRQLLKDFREIRSSNLAKLKTLNLTEENLDRKGIHPEFGDVTLRQLLSTWAVHDLTHLSQVTRVMAKQYKTAVGPWVKYLRVLQ
ncbi:MAG TPA: DinB family protein [Chitinophagaceae bacterium]|jgi:hypothetical protein